MPLSRGLGVDLMPIEAIVLAGPSSVREMAGRHKAPSNAIAPDSSTIFSILLAAL